MSDETPWDLYTKTMFNLFGFPLWHADTEEDVQFGRREIELGSVGFVERGRFRHFFNARKGANDPFNVGKLPPNFEQFSPPNLVLLPAQPILRQPYVASSSVGGVEVTMEGDAVASPVASLLSAGGNVSFECKQNAGALLVLEEPGMGQSIRTKRHIVTYLRTHAETWFEWASSETRGRKIKMEDIKFVSGTLKTSKWACAAFPGSYCGEKGALKVDVAEAGDININVAIGNQVVPAESYNHGPSLNMDATSRLSISSDRLLAATEDLGGESSPSRCDQCIFFHYFAVKKRILLPQKRPSDNESGMEGTSPVPAAPGSATGYVISEQPLSGETDDGTSDPVAILLDYMLAKTKAEYAIASDRDVIAIFGPTGVPDDIMAGLETINPPIGVATVTVDMTWLEQQTSTDVVMKGDEEVAGDLRSVGQVEDAPGVLAGPESEQASVDPANGDALKGEEGEEGEEDEDGGNNNGAATGQPLAPQTWVPAVSAHTGSVTSLAVSPDSQWAATGSDDTMIILWEAKTQSVVRRWESHGDIVWHLAFSPDSLRLASSGGEGRIMVWDVDTGELLGTLEGHTETIHTVVWSPDGTKLASGSDDMSVRIWDGQSYEQLHVLEGHNAMVTFVLFSHSGQYLASGGADYNTRIWDVATGTLHKELRGHRGMVWTASFDPEDNRIATASDDGSVRIWKVETGEELVMLHEHHGPVWVVSFSPFDGKLILSGSSDSTLKICDSFSGERVIALEGHDSMINSATFSPDGRFVASASSDNTVRFWRMSDATNLKTFNEHNDKVTHAIFSPDGATLSSGSDDGTVRIRLLRDLVNLDE